MTRAFFAEKEMRARSAQQLYIGIGERKCSLQTKANIWKSPRHIIDNVAAFVHAKFYRAAFIPTGDFWFFLVPRLSANFMCEYWTARWDLSLGFLLKTSFNYGLLTWLKLAPHNSSTKCFYQCKIAHGGEHNEHPVTLRVNSICNIDQQSFSFDQQLLVVALQLWIFISVIIHVLF